MNSAQPKPRVRCTEPPQAMCGWCGQWDTFGNLTHSPAGIFKEHALLGNNWPIHAACYAEWFDRM